MSSNGIERLNWDSEFFGLEIGAIRNFDINDQSHFKFDSQYDLIYIFSEQSLPAHSFPDPIDQKIVFKKKEPKTSNSDPNIEIYKGELTPELIQLSIQSGAYSRFKLDKKLQPHFEKLYTEWVDKSIQGSLADLVLVYKTDDKIVGFMTLKKGEDYNQIGLISVSANYRGKGIGSALLDKIADIFPGTETRVPTQAKNENACKFYVQNGYNIHSTTYIYHIWK